MKFFRNLFGPGRVVANADVLLMVAVGKVYSWDGHTVKRIGGMGLTNCIAEHKNELFEGAISGVYRFTREGSQYVNEQIAEGETIVALCSHGGELYLADSGSPDHARNEVRHARDGAVVAGRESRVTALASAMGKLFDGGWYGIRDTFSNSAISNAGPWPCDALCDHAGKLHAVVPCKILDATMGKEVMQCPGSTTGASICSHCHHLLYAAWQDGIWDAASNGIVFPYDSLASARGKLGPVSVAHMISVGALTYLAITKGMQAALDAIETEYREQLLPQTVRDTFSRLNAVRVDVVGIVDPGTKPLGTQSMLMGNAMAEFTADPRLGILHGRGKGHALIKTEALRSVASKGAAHDYVSLAKAVFTEGYHIKNVEFLRFDR